MPRSRRAADEDTSDEDEGMEEDDDEMDDDLALDLDAAEAIQSLAGGHHRRPTQQRGRRGSGGGRDASPPTRRRSQPASQQQQQQASPPDVVALRPPRRPRTRWHRGRGPADSEHTGYDEAQLERPDEYAETAAMDADERQEEYGGLAPRRSPLHPADEGRRAKRPRSEQPVPGGGAAVAKAMAALMQRQGSGPLTAPELLTAGYEGMPPPFEQPLRDQGSVLLAPEQLARQGWPPDMEQRHSNSMPAPGRRAGGALAPSSPVAAAAAQLQAGAHLPQEWLLAGAAGAPAEPDLAPRSSTTQGLPSLAMSAAAAAAAARAKGSGGGAGPAAPLLVLRPEDLVPVEGGLLALPAQVGALAASASIQVSLAAAGLITYHPARPCSC